MIRVRDLRVDYDDICAVKDLSLEVGAGEVCGLIGPNGAGKTTTMRAMLGLIEPTYGEIELAGVDMREHPRDANRVVGFMPDFPPMYEDLRCWEFLDLFAASYGLPKGRRPEAIETQLEVVGLTGKRDAAIVELSRGMRQRLMLAKTLIPDPQVLILDEPASGVDPQGRIDLKNVLKAQAAQGKTVLVSSHILAEMTEFCTAMAIMQKGQMVISGTIDEIRTQILGGTTLVIEVIGPADGVRRVVEGRPLCGPLGERDGQVELRFEGDAADASALLADLIGAGVRVASFARRKEGLEELFLAVGARELS